MAAKPKKPKTAEQKRLEHLKRPLVVKTITMRQYQDLVRGLWYPPEWEKP